MAGLSYTVVRVLLTVGRAAESANDTASYRLGGISLLGNAPRTWVVPLLLELPDRWVVLVQATLGGAAFVTLAIALAITLQDERLRLVALALVLALGLTSRVTYWDTVLLSESLAISLTALLMAGLAHIRSVPAWVLVAVFTLWLFTRDGHTYLGMLVVIGVGWWSWVHRRVALLAGLVLVLGWNVVSARNDRFVEGSTAAAGMAVYSLRDVDNFRWFVDHGMPVSGGFLQTSSLDANGAEMEPIQALFHATYFDDPDFRSWANAHGQRVYMEFLFAHPQYLIERLPHTLIDTGVRGEALVDQPVGSRRSILGVTWLWPDEASWYTFLLAAVAAMASLFVARAGRLDSRWIVPLAIIGSSAPHAWLALTASPFEYARHGVVLSFALVVACWWLLALCLDAVVHHRLRHWRYPSLECGREMGWARRPDRRVEGA